MTSKIFVAAAHAWLASVFLFGAAAAAPTPTPTPVTAPAGPALTTQDIETFLDGLVPLQIETSDIAGVTIAIVKDGKLLFAKGYGFADVEARKPVSPETTMFRTGSVTKLFTWTAVMQLVEQGKLDLDADVNAYLDFKVPQTFGKPVTLRNLMTHRGGFQEALKNLGAQDTGKVDLAKYVRENTPDQIFAPGTTPSYSNYGAALAGYIVERVSGVAFDKYVEDNIFRPLGMMHSTLRAPLPKEFEAQMSKGYVLGSGKPQDFEIVNGYPAGSQSASAMDMTKFMLAHLDGGALGDQRILRAETAALMHNSVTAYDPRQNGIALGFYEETRNGMRIIGHGGDTVYFHSDLHLIPDRKLGFFVSYNSAGRAETPARSPLWSKFLDRYFPFEIPASEAKQTGLLAKDVAGSYLSSRRADTSLLKLLTELGQATVTANQDGTITVDSFKGLNGQPRAWTALGEGVFRDKFGQSRLVFVEGGDGTLRMLSAASGVAIYERVTEQRNATYLLLLASVSFGILVFNLVGFPIAALVRRHYRVRQEWMVLESALRLLTMASIAVLLTFVAGIVVTLIATVSSSPWALTSAVDPSLSLFQQFGKAAVVGLVITGMYTLVAWRSLSRGVFGKLKESAVLLAYAGLLWFAWTMNMFDPALKF